MMGPPIVARNVVAVIRGVVVNKLRGLPQSFWLVK